MLYCEQLPPLAESDIPFPLSIVLVDEIEGDEGLELAEPDPDLVDARSFMATAIMASNAGNIALINGKAHREGDELKGGWIITVIDAKAKRVILKDPNGEQLTLSLNRSGSERWPLGLGSGPRILMLETRLIIGQLSNVIVLDDASRMKRSNK
jgi:hypothetical protein